MIECRTPNNKNEFDQYFHFRWLHLRKNWQQPPGSEQDELEPQAFHRIIVDEKGTIFGCARLHFKTPTTAIVKYVAIEPKSQGNGFGKILMTELEHLAARYGAQELVLDAREGAVKFYQALGYELGAKSHFLFNTIQHFRMVKGIESCNDKAVTELNQTWHETIPLSQFMNIAVTSFSSNELITHCDTLPNKNLHNTMFAGSISTLATLTGWGWCHLNMLQSENNGDIVLADGQTKYFLPIKNVAHGRVVNQIDIPNFDALSEGNKVRMVVTVEIVCGDKVAAKFVGKYVILPK